MSKNKRTPITAKDIRRMYRIFLIGAVLSLLFGFYVFSIIFLNPTPPYENLNEDTIAVEQVRYHARGRGGGYYGLTSSEGVEYHLSGDFQWGELQEKLVVGTEISIKWYSRDRLMLEKRYVEEIYLDGERLSAYTNDDGADRIFACVGGGALLVMGLAFWLFYRRMVAKEIRNLPKKYRS